MTKMVTVQAQQMWEYTSITRKTADYLVAELNEIGKLGWELVGTSYHKEVKTSLGESFCWTAILKRPLILPAHASSDEVTAGEASAVSSAVTDLGRAPDTDSSIFDVRSEDDDLQGGND